MRACSTDDICIHATRMLHTSTMEMRAFLAPLFYCPWFFPNILFERGGCCNPSLDYLYWTSNLLPMYLAAIWTSSFHWYQNKYQPLMYDPLWRHNVSTLSTIEKLSFCVQANDFNKCDFHGFFAKYVRKWLFFLASKVWSSYPFKYFQFEGIWAYEHNFQHLI